MAPSWVASSSGSSGPLALALAVAVCLTLGALRPAYAQDPGDVAITEVMIAPPSSSNNREWFEIVGVEATDLEGCDLRKGSTTDAAAATTFDTIAGSLAISAGEHLLFARNQDWVAGDGSGGDDIPADYAYAYTDSSFNNDQLLYLFIVCGGTTIDVAPMDWREFEDGCPDSGCSVNLGPAHYDADGNDDLDHWCLPPPDYTFTNSSGDTATGTPGEAGVCLTFDWPLAGDVLFTELMIAPADTPEWFELSNRTEADVEIGLCALRKWKLDGEGNPDASTIKEYTFGADGEPVTLAANGVGLFAYNSCIVSTGGDDDSAADEECEYADLFYDTVSFTNSAEEHLALVCPSESGEEVIVDQMSYDMEVMGIRDGHSILFVPSEFDDPATDNDDRQNWCEAAFSQCFHDPDGENCNYGTPGTIGECLEDDVDWPDNGPACRCQLSSRQSGAGAAALLAALVLWMTGRRRGGQR